MTHDKFIDLRNRKNLAKVVNRFLDDARNAGKKESTVRVYANRIKGFADYLDARNLALDEVQNDDIKAYISWLHENSQKNSTIKNILTTIYVLYTWGQKNGVVETVPLSPDDYPPVRIERIKRLNDNELRLVFNYVDNLQENVRAAFYLMFGTGARVGEVAHLTATDVTLRGRAVYIDIKDAKWGSDRCIPITDKKAAEVVWRFRQSVPVDRRPLFRVSKRTLQWYATKLAQDTGIAFRCHLLRHTYAARLTEQGVPITTIQYLLGHKSVAMTAYYAQSALVDVSDITPTI